jgi:hypothetical protein
MSDRHKPSKLIKNQNTSTMNADKLKAKMSETIISRAPPALSSEYFGDELGSLSSCRSKYATTISRTPMNPARSNKCKFIVIAIAIARRSESRVPAPHYNHCLTGSGQSTHETISCSESRSVFCDVILCVLIERAHRLWTGICLSNTQHEIMIKLGPPIS